MGLHVVTTSSPAQSRKLSQCTPPIFLLFVVVSISRERPLSTEAVVFRRYLCKIYAVQTALSIKPG